MSELRQSQSSPEARVISLQNETNRPDEHQGEPSFVVKPFTGETKERTEDAILSSIPHQIVRRLHMSAEN